MANGKSNGKGSTKQHQTSDQRVKRGKTPAQQAKTARNIREAELRLERLQRNQKLVKTLRGMGYTGSDNQIIDRFNAEQAEQERQRLLAAQNAEADAYVKAVLAVPTVGKIIHRWLASRITMAPIYVKELIVKFLNRDGSNGTHDNSHLKAAVVAALAPPESKAA
jgi:hypothetical protein